MLWIDEIEKGAGRVGSDCTGVTTRLVGQFLYWLQDSSARVFVDLPDADERRDIIAIYLRKYSRAPVERALLEAVAEIGHEAVRVGDHNVSDDYLRSAFRNVIPLSRSAPERIEEVRQLGERAIPASGRPPALGVVGGPPRARRGGVELKPSAGRPRRLVVGASIRPPEPDAGRVVGPRPPRAEPPPAPTAGPGRRGPAGTGRLAKARRSAERGFGRHGGHEPACSRERRGLAPTPRSLVAPPGGGTDVGACGGAGGGVTTVAAGEVTAWSAVGAEAG